MEVEARDVIRFQLVRDASELERGRSSGRTRFEFGPDYVHQIFDEEKIRGHESPVLTMRFTAHSLFLYGPELISIRPTADADDVIAKLKPFLPEQDDCRTDDLDVFKKKLTQPFPPLGKMISKYFVTEKQNEDPVEFQIRKADFSMKGVRKFHQRLRFFATCFIETASFIDDTDEKWSLLLLYRRRQPDESPNHSRFLDVAGYVTLYSFFSHPKGERLRLSQIVILPPYQRYGHGRQLLEAVYKEAVERNSFEVTVEDPAPVFQKLRDETDLRRVLEMNYFQDDTSNDHTSPTRKRRRPSLSTQHLHKWDGSYAAEIRQALKLTLAQIRRVYEMLKLHLLLENGDDNAWTEFRLEVKRRLQKEHIGSTRPNADERKRLLATLYDELIEMYTPIVNKVFSKLVHD